MVMPMTEATDRWRLVLGKYSERRLPPLTGDRAQQDSALSYLYDRLYKDRGLRGQDEIDGKGASLDASAPRAVEWLDAVNKLFPEEVALELTNEAVDRFGLTEILTSPDALKKVDADINTLKLLLSVRGSVPAAALAAVRKVVAAVVEDLSERLRNEIEAVITGRINPQMRTRRPTGAIDAQRTIEENLGTWDPERQKLLIENVTFFRRSKVRHPWDIILCIDQSGSMVSSVIHSAVLAGILSGLPGVTVKVVVFDTSVVDLTDVADDPVEMLMSVQLGGGTDIARAVQYCESIVSNPSRTMFALITDFYEGGSVHELLASIGRLKEAGVTLMGLASLEDGAGPSFDRNIAEAATKMGMPVAALTPKSFAQWAAEVMQ